MTQTDRILDRMAAAGIKPSVAAEKLGLAPGFFSDLKTGRKKSVSADILPGIAAMLGVDVRYLLGMTDDPGGGGCSGAIKIAGVSSPTAWFQEGRDPWAGRTVDAQLDLRFPEADQVAFICQHDGENPTIPANSIVIVNLRETSPRPGDMIVAERKSDGFVQRICGEYLIGADAEPKIVCAAGIKFPASEFSAVGRITRIVQVL